MSVSVYPRLGELLRVRNLSVAELERQIERRFGMTVDPKTLYRLTAPAAVHRADLEVAGAAAAVLGVGLADLFSVEATPVDAETTESPDLAPDVSRRIAALFERQAQAALSESERAELEQLVGEYGRRLHERRLQELAQERGISVEHARRESERQLDDAMRWWRAFESDAGRRRAVAMQARLGGRAGSRSSRSNRAGA